MVYRILYKLEEIKFFTLLYTLFFAASINIGTTLLFTSSMLSRVKYGLLIVSVYLLISGWYLIILDSHITKYINISRRYGEDYSKLIERLRDNKESYINSLIVSFAFLVLTIIILILIFKS